METGRRFVSAEGRIYHVYLAPFEGTAGARQLLNAVVFEGAGGEWIGSVPVYHQVSLESLSDSYLEELLERVRGRE